MKKISQDKSDSKKFSSLEECINSLNALKIIQQNPLLPKKLVDLQNKIKSEEFQLVILGQFKRGKTTLINALLGENLLPTAVVPLTSIITVLKFALTQRVTVVFQSGQTKSIKLSEIENYVTEPKNPKNVKEVDQVIIEHPSQYLKKGVQIIDTPGVGSIYKHNTDVALEFVPKADAGIFVFTTDPPISHAELEFLTAIKDYLGKIFFVQNKIDQVEEKDRKLSLEFTKKVIEDNLEVSNLMFYPLSAKLGLEGKVKQDKTKLNESKLPLFETYLEQFLINEKGQVFTKSVASKLLNIIKEASLMLDVEREALGIPVSLLKDKISAFEKELEKIKQEKEDSGFVLQGQAEKLANQVLIEDIERLQEEKLPVLHQKFDQFYKDNLYLSGSKLSDALDSFLEKSIRSVFADFRRKEEKKLEESLKNIMDKFGSQTNESIEKVINLSANLFNLKVEKFKADVELAEQVEFKFVFDEIQVEIEVYKPMISHLPKFLSHRLLYKNMRAKIADEFDRHCGRVRYDFHERVIKTVVDYKNALNETLEETIKGIQTAMDQALAQKDKGQTEQKQTASSIKQQSSILTNTKDEIMRVLL